MSVLQEFLEGTRVSPVTSYFVPKLGQNHLRVVVKGKPVLTYRSHFLKYSMMCALDNCWVCRIAETFDLPDFRAREMRAIYVADLDDPNPLIKLFTFGPSIAGKLNLIASNTEILDEAKGAILILQRSGQGRNTRYEIVPSKILDLRTIPQYIEEYKELPPLQEALQNERVPTPEVILNDLKDIVKPDVYQAIADWIKEVTAPPEQDVPTPTITTQAQVDLQSILQSLKKK